MQPIHAASQHHKSQHIFTSEKSVLCLFSSFSFLLLLHLFFLLPTNFLPEPQKGPLYLRVIKSIDCLSFCYYWTLLSQTTSPAHPVVNPARGRPFHSIFSQNFFFGGLMLRSLSVCSVNKHHRPPLMLLSCWRQPLVGVCVCGKNWTSKGLGDKNFDKFQHTSLEGLLTGIPNVCVCVLECVVRVNKI